MSAWQIAIDFIRRLDYNEIHPDSRKDLTQTMKLVCLISALLLALFFVLPAAGESEFYTEMPSFLRFSQETVQETIEEGTHILRTYPDTANDQVDTQMHALIDAMAQENRALLSPPTGSVPSYLDVGAIVSRTGTSVLSFLTLAEVTTDMEHLSVDFCTRVYDIQTGEQLSLSRFLEPDSGAWAILASAVHSQLSEAFPGMEPDRVSLDQLCSAESLRDAAFTLGATRLTLTYRADALYPGTNTLLHVHIPYPDIREMMTDYGKAQTDNSRFKMLALTYDDGPARGTTRKLLEALRRHGAQATFFIVGKNIARNHDILSLQQNHHAGRNADETVGCCNGDGSTVIPHLILHLQNQYQRQHQSHNGNCQRNQHVPSGLELIGILGAEEIHTVSTEGLHQHQQYQEGFQLQQIGNGLQEQNHYAATQQKQQRRHAHGSRLITFLFRFRIFHPGIYQGSLCLQGKHDGNDAGPDIIDF